MFRDTFQRNPFANVHAFKLSNDYGKNGINARPNIVGLQRGRRWYAWVDSVHDTLDIRSSNEEAWVFSAKEIFIM